MTWNHFKFFFFFFLTISYLILNSMSRLMSPTSTLTALTHPVHFHLDTPSKSWLCGRHCRRPVSVRSHRRTNSTLWKCVPARWPGTPSHHPLPCKYRCCCRSSPRPEAAETHGEHGVRSYSSKADISQVYKAGCDSLLVPGATQHAWHLVCESSPR